MRNVRTISDIAALASAGRAAPSNTMTTAIMTTTTGIRAEVF